MTDRRSGMVQSLGYPQNSSIVSRAVAAAAANNHHSSRHRGRGSKRYSVSVFYSMAAEQDVEVEDELAQGLYMLLKCRLLLTFI
ncbi:Putative IQ domain-containing protein containing GTPase activating protein [Rhizopus microsporus]|nr:Putative IQ domain-containing protein containing GTPase activating protein [Rhizopus microsporus]